MVFSQVKDIPSLADDPDLNFGTSVSSIVKEASSSVKDDPSVSPQSNNPAKELISELQNIPPPKIAKREEDKDSNDTTHRNTLNLCQRDYSKPCPLGFSHQYIENRHRCSPPINYSGPCIGQDIIYATMDIIEKNELSKNCLFNWPCVECDREYSNYCPDDWELINDGSLTCRPTVNYNGPCKDNRFSFIGYNIKMQKEWSHKCHSWWPCLKSTKI